VTHAAARLRLGSMPNSDLRRMRRRGIISASRLGRHQTGTAMKKKRQASGLPPINDRISFLMHRIDAQLAVICNPHFRQIDVVLHQSRILVILLEGGPVRVADLVQLMVLPQSTISHQLRELEKHGLITRKPDRNDSRATKIELTSKGKRTAQQCNALSTDIYQTMVDTLSKSEVEVLRAQLRGIFERLEDFRQEKVAERSGRLRR